MASEALMILARHLTIRSMNGLSDCLLLSFEHAKEADQLAKVGEDQTAKPRMTYLGRSSSDLWLSVEASLDISDEQLGCSLPSTQLCRDVLLCSTHNACRAASDRISGVSGSISCRFASV